MYDNAEVQQTHVSLRADLIHYRVDWVVGLSKAIFIFLGIFYTGNRQGWKYIQTLPLKAVTSLYILCLNWSKSCMNCCVKYSIASNHNIDWKQSVLASQKSTFVWLVWNHSMYWRRPLFAGFHVDILAQWRMVFNQRGIQFMEKKKGSERGFQTSLRREN